MNQSDRRVPKVLFAEDDEDTLALYQLHSEQRGWNGVFVKTARAIIDEVNQSKTENDPFDVVVADINYFNQEDGPHITGITAAWELRRNSFNIPILFVSAYVNHIIRAEAKRVGGAILQKPVDFNYVFDQIAYLVEWHRQAFRQGALRHSVPLKPGDGPLTIPPIIDKTIKEARLEYEKQ